MGLPAVISVNYQDDVVSRAGDFQAAFRAEPQRRAWAGDTLRNLGSDLT